MDHSGGAPTGGHDAGTSHTGGQGHTNDSSSFSPTPDAGPSGSPAYGDPIRGFEDAFNRTVNNPGVRRGARIFGRVAIGYTIFFVIFFLAVLSFILYGFTQVLGSGPN